MPCCAGSEYTLFAHASPRLPIESIHTCRYRNVTTPPTLTPMLAGPSPTPASAAASAPAPAARPSTPVLPGVGVGILQPPGSSGAARRALRGTAKRHRASDAAVGTAHAGHSRPSCLLASQRGAGHAAPAFIGSTRHLYTSVVQAGVHPTVLPALGQQGRAAYLGGGSACGMPPTRCLAAGKAGTGRGMQLVRAYGIDQPDLSRPLLAGNQDLRLSPTQLGPQVNLVASEVLAAAELGASGAGASDLAR